MITVNAAGEIVLQSLTRAQSFQITPASVTTAPTSSGTASLSTATALTAGVSAFVVTTVSSPATGHGVTLPTPSVGAQVVLLQGQTTFTTYTIWTSSSSVFVNDDSSSNSIVVYNRKVVCQAISTTRWQCDSPVAGNQNGMLSQTLGTSATAVTAPTPSQSGSVTFLTTTATTAVAHTLALYSCSSATVGNVHEWILYAGATNANSLTLVITTNAISNTWVAKVVTAAATATIANTVALSQATTTATFEILKSTTGVFQTIKAVCTPANVWIAYGLGSTTA